MSAGCDRVGGIVNGGDDKMGEEGQHGRNDVVTIMVVSKSTIGGPVRRKWQIAAEGTLGTPRGTCTRRHFAC